MKEDIWYLKLSLNIVAVFIIAITLSYVPVKFPEFFGDWLCEGRVFIAEHYDKANTKIYDAYTGCDYGTNDRTAHNPCWHWGYQHWLWFFMGICLFVVQIFRIVQIINKKQNADKNNP